MAAVADVPVIKSLEDRPTVDLLVAPTVRIWVTPKLCKGNDEGDTAGLKAPLHPSSGGTNTGSA